MGRGAVLNNRCNLPSKSRSRSQAKSDKRAIAKLRDAGLLPAKTSLAKKPTPATRRIINKFKDVVSGKAVAVKPAHPERFKGVYDVKGGVVVIPKRKGERITVDKEGVVRTNLKRGKKLVRGRGITRGRGGQFELERGEQIALPYNRGGGEIYWMTFPSIKVMEEMESPATSVPYAKWRQYAVAISIEDDPNEDSDLSEKLQARIERRIGRGLNFSNYKKRGKRKGKARGGRPR